MTTATSKSTPKPVSQAQQTTPGEADMKGPTKIAAVLALLTRQHGATLDEMVKATGWQAHTTRAALTGLKKKGHAITRKKRDDVSCYHLEAPHS